MSCIKYILFVFNFIFVVSTPQLTLLMRTNSLTLSASDLSLATMTACGHWQLGGAGLIYSGVMVIQDNSQTWSQVLETPNTIAIVSALGTDVVPV